MKKAHFLALAIAFPVQAMAIDTDSVYSWGTWAQNIQPAAGPQVAVAPTAVKQPEVNFRPNENAAFNRATTPPSPIVTPPAPTVVVAAPPIVPDQPQLPEIVTAPVDAPVIDAGDLPATSGLSLP